MPVKTKGEHIVSAFNKLRISGLTVNPTPNNDAQALDVLEDMLYEVEGNGSCVNYAFEESPDPATPSGINPSLNNAIASNLAYRLLPNFKKSPEQYPILQRQASQSMSQLVASVAKMPRYRMPRRMAVGSGNTFRFGVEWVRFYREDSPEKTDCNLKKLEIGVSSNYIVSWRDWLSDGEVISSYTIKSTSGLTVSGDQIQGDSTEIFFIAKGETIGRQSVSFSIVTSDSTPNTADLKKVEFNVVESD